MLKIQLESLRNHEKKINSQKNLGNKLDSQKNFEKKKSNPKKTMHTHPAGTACACPSLGWPLSCRKSSQAATPPPRSRY